jgi:hypothetical protein
MNEEYIVLLLPFAMFGVWKIMHKVKAWQLVKKGYFKATFRMANHRKNTTFVKPEKSWIKTGNRVYPFSEDSGFIYYNSGTPEIEYDYDGQQINFENVHKSETIDPIRLHLLVMRFFNLGKKSVKGRDNLILPLLIVACGISAICLMLLLGMNGVGMPGVS